MDPKEAYASKVKFKEECDCKYDCLLGQFCEVPVQCVCINQCSGHGHCRGGFCQVFFSFYIFSFTIMTFDSLKKEINSQTIFFPFIYEYPK